MAIHRRHFFTTLPLFIAAVLLGRGRGDAQAHAIVSRIGGLAAPTAPLGACGSPIDRPNRNTLLRYAAGIEFEDLIDDSKPYRFIRVDDGWYWGVPIKNIQPIGGNASIILDDFLR